MGETVRMITVNRSAVAAVARVPIRCVIDFNEYGDLIGVEALRVAAETARLSLPPPMEYAEGDVKVSFDEEADALYVRISKGRAPRQQSVDGVLSFAQDGMLVTVELPE